MKVDRYLTLLGDEYLRSALPEGAMLVEEINKHTTLKHSYKELTGNQARDLIETLESYHQKKILAWELNDGLESERQRKEARTQLERSRSGKILKPLVAIGMCFLVTVLTLAYTGMILWVSYHTKTLPDWEQMVLPYIVPGFVMWKYFGIINDETKALMQAVVESTPAGSLVSKLADLRHSKGRAKPTTDDEYNLRPPPPPSDG